MLWETIHNFFAPWWWVFACLFLLTVLLCILVIKAKNARIRKLKKQYKATRTQLEASQSRDSVIVRTADEGGNRPAAQQATPVGTALTTVEADAEYEPTTVDLDGADETQAADEPDDRTQTLDYYSKPSVIAPSRGTAKFIVSYDRVKDSWVIRREGNARVTRRVDTKEEAMQIARTLCRKYNANLQVHKKDGKFQKQ